MREIIGLLAPKLDDGGAIRYLGNFRWEYDWVSESDQHSTYESIISLVKVEEVERVGNGVSIRKQRALYVTNRYTSPKGEVCEMHPQLTVVRIAFRNRDEAEEMKLLIDEAVALSRRFG